jgi:hypothetical protein
MSVNAPNSPQASPKPPVGIGGVSGVAGQQDATDAPALSGPLVQPVAAEPLQLVADPSGRIAANCSATRSPI